VLKESRPSARRLWKFGYVGAESTAAAKLRSSASLICSDLVKPDASRGHAGRVNRGCDVSLQPAEKHEDPTGEHPADTPDGIRGPQRPPPPSS